MKINLNGRKYKIFTVAKSWPMRISHLSGALLAVAGLGIDDSLSLLIHGNELACGKHFHIRSFHDNALSFIHTDTHILPMGKAKDLFFNFDRIAIYLLIAGTYTPIALVTLNGPLGWIIFGIEWGLALIGTTVDPDQTRGL